jgi:hypothetical protein
MRDLLVGWYICFIAFTLDLTHHFFLTLAAQNSAHTLATTLCNHSCTSTFSTFFFFQFSCFESARHRHTHSPPTSSVFLFSHFTSTDMFHGDCTLARNAISTLLLHYSVLLQSRTTKQTSSISTAKYL